jgi:hypothetical protein
MYADVLQNDQARDLLARYDDLTLAASVIRQAGVADQLKKITRQLEALLVDVPKTDVDRHDLEAASQLRSVADTLEAAIARRVDA